MAKQTINIGTAPNDGTGTPLRTAFDYCNLNFTELYTAVGPSGNNIVVPGSATITGDLTVRTNKLLVNSSGVGFGVSPNYPVDVLSTGVIAQFLRDLAVDTGIQIQADNGGAIIQTIGTHTLSFYTNFAERYKIDSTGVSTWSVGGSTAMTLNSTGLGIGAVPSNYRLYVSAAFASGLNGAYIESGEFNKKSLVVNHTNASVTANLFEVQKVGTAQFLVDSSGNVGVGVTPGTKFDVGLTGAGTPRIRFTSAFDNPILEFQRYSGVASDYYGERLITGGGFYFQTAPAAAVGSQTFTTRMTLDASGRLILLASTTTPATLSTNGQLTMTATSDTNLRFSYRGSDGVTRVANLTLA